MGLVLKITLLFDQLNEQQTLSVPNDCRFRVDYTIVYSKHRTISRVIVRVAKFLKEKEWSVLKEAREIGETNEHISLNINVYCQ